MMRPTRKQIRLTNYDYSQNGAYFITFCTRNRQPLLWENAVGTASGRPPLSHHGVIVEDAIHNINSKYSGVHVDKYVVMPNHVHMILVIQQDCGRPMAVPTISRVLNQCKGYASRQSGFSLWQARYYEHVIRNEQDYLDIWEYIDSNPSRWLDDEYYLP
jgi:REP element-mobilizing transposase RayT